MLSCLINPALIKSDVISPDARERARKYTTLLDTPLGKIHIINDHYFIIGAYTSNSKGFMYAREKICDFIKNRDGVDLCDPKNIYLTNGAGEGVKLVFNMLIRNSNDGIMIPIPQYPLYSALITLFGGKQNPYYLDET